MFAVLHSYTKCVCVCVPIALLFSKIRCTCLLAANLKHDKNMEQSLVKLIHFLGMIHVNIVGGFQRKAIELMNNVNKIIKIRSTLDLR